MEFLHFDLAELVKTVGYLGLFAIIFAESGLLFGIFLPGDSLLFTAGFLASQGFLNLYILLPLLFAAAVTGDSVGYAFGRKVGKKIFTRQESFFFHKDHLVRAKKFYDKHGGKTITIARFMPVIRTLAPILAGVGEMPYPRFLFFNILGAFSWAILIPLSGFFLGSAIPGIDRYLLPIIIFIIAISVAPSVIHVLREKKDRQQLMAILKKILLRLTSRS